MSSLVHPPNSKNIHVDVPIPGRKPARISTKTHDREAAKIIGGVLQKFAKNNHGKKVTKLTVMQTANMLTKTVNDELERDLVIERLPQLATETALSDGNEPAKEVVVRRFLIFLKEKQLESLDMWAVTAKHISEFYAWARVNYKFGDSSHRVYGHTLGGLFEAARRYKMVAENVVRDVKLPKRPKDSPRRPFTREEIRRVYLFADDEWRGMITVGACTGMRIGDVSLLVVGDIDFDTGFIRPLSRKVRLFESKPLPPVYLAWLRSRFHGKPAGDPLFPRAYKRMWVSGKLNPTQVSRDFVNLLCKAGVRTAGEKVRGVERVGAKKFLPLSFHCLRHTYTTMLKIVCASEAIARELVGHRSALVSAVYTHLDEHTLREAVKDVPNLFEGMPTP